MITKEQAQAKLDAFIAGNVHVMTISVGAEAIRTVIALLDRVHRLEAIGRRILEGDARGQGVQWSEAMSELEAILKETTHD